MSLLRKEIKIEAASVLLIYLLTAATQAAGMVCPVKVI